MLKKTILFNAGLLFGLISYSQNVLQDSVTISFENTIVREALIQLESETGLRFSYNPDLLPKSVVNKNYTKNTLESILDDLLSPNYDYLVRGKFIILTPGKTKKMKASIEVKGEVVDASTGNQIPNATIYEVNQLSSTLSSSNGSYQLSTKAPGKEALVMISKQNYKDTLISVSERTNDYFKVLLEPKKTPITDSIEIPKFLIGERIKSHVRNINLDIDRFAQVSFVPGISSNGGLNNQITNNLSLNIIGGYAGGLRGVELSGLFNLERKAIDGVQIAGAANVVGGSSSAFQIAGAYNHIQRQMAGIQLSGAVNTVNDRVYGLQVAGGVNYSKQMDGIQASGAVNFATGGNGLQLSGAYNYSGDTFSGLQVSGLINKSNKMKGLQVTSLYNESADSLKGLQISGFINKTKVLTGVQVGIINIGQKIHHGTQIGIFNISKNGLTAFDFEYNDVTEYNFSFKSGAKHFYTILATGLSQKNDIWTTGFGLGSQHNLGPSPFYLALEFSSHLIYPTNQKIEGLPLDSRFNLDLGANITKRISLHGGPVLHFLYYHDYLNYPNFRIDEKLGEHTIYTGFKDTFLNKWWIGYRVGLRL